MEEMLRQLSAAQLDSLYLECANGCSETAFIALLVPFFPPQTGLALRLRALFNVLVGEGSTGPLTLPRLCDVLSTPSSSLLSANDNPWGFFESEKAAASTVTRGFSLRCAQVHFVPALRVVFASDDAGPRVAVYSSTLRATEDGWRRVARMEAAGGGHVLAMEWVEEYALLVVR